MPGRLRFATNLLCVLGLAALPAVAGKVLVLPMPIDTTRIHDHKVVQDFFFEAVENLNGGEAVRDGGDSLCAERACALERAAAAKADQVIYGQIRFLGRKCFFTGNIANADGSRAFSQTLNVLGVADFENATKRMAAALLKREALVDAANIDNITENEQYVLANRRRSFYSIGGSIGYLYPVSGSYKRWKQEDYYGYCPDADSLGRCPSKEESYSQMVVLSFDNWFEFRPELAMELNLQYAIPMGFGVDVAFDYLMGRGDFTPFAGGGVGLHGVLPDQGRHEDNDKTNTGPTLNLQGGMIFFRTYSVNLVAKAAYHLILNTDRDNGFEALLGIRTRF
jgi:hypothetical protein